MYCIASSLQERYLLVLAFAGLLGVPAGFNPASGDLTRHLGQDSEAGLCFIQTGIWHRSIHDGAMIPDHPSFFLNPPTDFTKKKTWVNWLINVVSIFLFLFLIGVLLFLLASFWGRILGKAVEAGIETFDQRVIGVDVNIEALTFNPCTGRFVLDNMIIDNPKGFMTEYLLKVGRVNVDVSMTHLIYSGGKKIVINCSEFCGVDVIYENSFTTSNVDEILNFMEKKHKKIEKEKDQQVTQKQKLENVEGQGAETQVILKKVVVADVGIKAAATFCGGGGVRVAVGDFKYSDFSKEVGNSIADDIIIILMESFLKTIAANVVGKTKTDMHA